MAGVSNRRWQDFVKANPGPHICQCGCGSAIELQMHHIRHGVSRFLPGHRNGTPETRLRKKIFIDHAGCWIWTGSRYTNGYGKISVHGRAMPVHRFSYMVHHGSLSPELVVCHKCDKPLCVNPNCLFQGTYKDNSEDMVGKSRQAWGEKSGNAKMSEKEVAEIRNRYASGGVSIRQLAEEYGMSQSATRNLIRGERWGMLDGAIAPVITSGGGRKLTADQAREIKAGCDAGVSFGDLAERFNVTKTMIRNIARGRAWAHLFSTQGKS